MHRPSMNIWILPTCKHLYEFIQETYTNWKSTYNIQLWGHFTSKIYNTHELLCSHISTHLDSPCGRTKYDTSVWKRRHVLKWAKLSPATGTRSVEIHNLLSWARGQNLDKVEKHTKYPISKFDHSCEFMHTKNTHMYGIDYPHTYVHTYTKRQREEGAIAGVIMTTTTCSAHPRGVISKIMTPYAPFDSHSRCG